MKLFPEIECTYYGSHYSGGQIIFLQDRKEIVFSCRNLVSIINLTTGLFKTINFHLRSNIFTFDIDNIGAFILAIDSSNLLVLANLKNSKIISKMILPRKCWYIKCSPMGKYFAIGAGKKIEIWKFSYSKLNCQQTFQLSRIYNAHYSDISIIDWNDDGKYIISLGVDKIIKIFSFRKRSSFPKVIVNSFHKGVSFIKFNFHSNNFLVLDENNVLSEWYFNNKFKIDENSIYKNNKNLQLIRSFKLSIQKSRILSVWMHIFSNILFTTLTNGHICYFQVPKTSQLYVNNSNKKIPIYNNKILQVNLFKINHIDISFLSGSLNSNLIAIGRIGKKEIIIYDWDKKKFILKHQNFISKITCLSLSPNDNLVCTGNQKGDVTIWSLISGFSIIKFHNHIARVNRIVFLENSSRVLVTSSDDSTIKTYDLKKCFVSRTMASSFPYRNFDALGIDKTGSLVASACSKTFSILIWSIKNGSLIEILKGHQSIICDIYFSRENLKLITGSADKSLRIWYLEERIVKNKNCLCEIFQTCSKIHGIGYHPYEDQIAVLDSLFYVSFFKIEKIFSLTCIPKNIKQEKLNILFDSKFDPHFSLEYSFDGKKIFIKDYKDTIYSFQCTPFLYLDQFKIFSKVFKNPVSGKFQNKNCLKSSRKKSLYLVLSYEKFCVIKEIAKNYFFSQIINEKTNIINQSQWKKTFEWIVSINNENLFFLLLDTVPLVLAKKFFNLFFELKFQYISFFNIENVVLKTKYLVKKCYNFYGTSFLIFLIEIDSKSKSFLFSSDLKKFRKHVSKQLEKAICFMHNLLNVINISKFSLLLK